MTENQNFSIKKLLMGSFGTFLSLVVLGAVFAILSRSFLSFTNLRNVLIQSGTNAMIAVGMTLVIITGNIDISVGSSLALSSCLGATVMVKTGNVPLGILVTLLVGVILGLINGLLVAYLGFPPFIVTMSNMWLFRGSAYLFTGGMAVTGLPTELSSLVLGSVWKIPNIVVLLIIVYLLFHLFLTQTTIGRKMFAVGDNRESARLSGINTKSVILLAYIICGVMAAVAGLIYMGRLNSGQPIAGQSYEMYAIAAAVIGGASLTQGGIGNMVGTLIGAVFISVLNNGLTILNVNTYWQQVCMGIVLLLAIGLDKLRKSIK